MSVLKHTHWFTSLYWHFGPYGRQDVHLHSCIEEGKRGARCKRLLVGTGRECDAKSVHRQETLGGAWSRRDA
jgi:hypothetical protein